MKRFFKIGPDHSSGCRMLGVALFIVMLMSLCLSVIMLSVVMLNVVAPRENNAFNPSTKN
jgi:hypothetical protein